MHKARSQGKIKTEKINKSCHPAGVLTKLLQGKEYAFKRGRLLGLRAKPSSSAAVATGASGA